MMNTLLINKLTQQNRYVERIVSFIVLLLFIFFLGKGIIQSTEGASLGGLFRIFLPSVFYFLLFIFFSLIDLGDIKTFFNFSEIRLKQAIPTFCIALFLAYPIIIIGSNYGLTDAMIGLIIIFGFISSVYFVVIGNASLGVTIFLLTFPFLSYFEHYYGYKYIFWGKIEWGPILLTPSGIFIIFLFLATLISQYGKKLISELNTPIVKAAFIFIFIVFVSSLISQDPVVSFKNLSLEYLYPVLFFIVALRSIHTMKDVKMLSHATITCVCLISFFSLYFFLRRSQGMVQLHDIYGSIMATHISSGTWGKITAMALPLAITLFALSRKNIKIVYIFVISFILMSIVLSFARAAMAAILVSLPVLLKERKLRTVVFAGVVILTIVFSFQRSLFSKYVLYRFQHIRSFNDLVYDTSVQARIEAAKAAIGMAKDQPLLGIGIGLWDQHVPYYAKMQSVVVGSLRGHYRYGRGYIMDAHNRFCQVLADSGILGFTAWIFLIFTILKESIFVLRRTKDDIKFMHMLGVFSCMICFLVLSFTGGGFSRSTFLGYNLLFWIIVAMIIKINMFEKLNSNTRE
ncbi:MAG: hypothetical protein GF384_00735 [Elusimicrobia bacterium]|nr:hypothetical protein [Elusimicrobiota bacterium]